MHKLTGQSIDYIKKSFSKRLADNNFCGITYSTTVTDKVRTRKQYSLPQPISNFRFIRKEVFEDNNLSSEEKGFLISLYCNCVNNSFSLGLSVNELLTRIKIKKSSFYTLRNSLIKKGYIHKIKDMPPFFRSEDFSEDYMLTCPWLGHENFELWIKKNQYERYED